MTAHHQIRKIKRKQGGVGMDKEVIQVQPDQAHPELKQTAGKSKVVSGEDAVARIAERGDHCHQRVCGNRIS
jgi:hypothetical protein